MKGIILAGGSGTRLYPITKGVSKQLLPVYDKPMIMYPINTLKKAGITDILLVLSREHAGQFTHFLGAGATYGVKISYIIQEEAKGIAAALQLAKDFVGQDTLCVILADNILEDAPNVTDFVAGARVFLKKVPDPERFGVATVQDGKLVDVIEKPEHPASDLAVIGIYVYDHTVFDVIPKLNPSKRGELEITEVNKYYVETGNIDYRVIEGFWSDAGTHDSLLRSSLYVKENKEKFTDE